MFDLERLVSALVIRPGDTLVLATSDRITAVGAESLRSRLLDRLPGLSGVVVIDNTSALAVYRPDQEAPDA